MTRNTLWLLFALFCSQILLTACAHDDHLPTGDVRKYGDGEPVSTKKNMAEHHYRTEYSSASMSEQ